LILYDKSRVHEEKDDGNVDFDLNQFIHLLDEGHRFVMLTFWQMILPDPTQSSPLGLLSMKYQKSKDEEEEEEETLVFPDACPDLQQRLWYCFPEMISEEY